MKSTAQFYHAGCPVCLGAEQMILAALDRTRYDIEVIHLGTDKGRLPEAEQLGVKSVPALVIDGKVYHINFGASLADLK
jgi:glutaredoxin